MANDQNVNVGITANTAGLDQLNSTIAKLEGTLNGLTNMLSSVSGASANAGNAIGSVASKASEGGSKFNSLGSGVNMSSTAMSFLAGVAGGAATLALQKLGGAMAALNPLTFARDLSAAAKELEKTASAMNMTAERAQALNDVIEDAELAPGDVTAAMRKLNMQLSTNEDGLNKMGIATRDANGQLVSQEKLFGNAVAALNTYKAGTDRNAAATEVFGRANIDLEKAMLITSEAVDESEKRMSELNNTMSPSRMKDAADYRQAMRDLGDVTEGLSNTIGAAVLPAMTEFATKLAELGESLLPVVMEAADMLGEAMSVMGTVFSEVMAILGEVFTALLDVANTLFGGIFTGLDETGNKALDWKAVMSTAFLLVKEALIGFSAVFQLVVGAVKAGFDFMYNVVAGAVEVILARLFAFAEAAKRAMSLDFSGAKAAWDAGAAQIEQTIKKRYDNILKSSQEFRDKFEKVAAETAQKVAAAQAGGGKLPAETVASKVYGGGPGSRAFVSTKGTAGAGADKEASNIVKAQQDLAKSLVDYSMKLYKESMREQEAELKRSLDQRLITNEEYFSKLSALKDEEFETEIRLKEAEVSTIREAMDQKNLKMSERIKFQAQEIRLTAEIRELEMKRAESQREFTEQARRATEQIDKQKASMVEQIANMSGIGILESKLSSIARKFAELPKELIESSQARSLRSLEEMGARLEDFDRKAKEQLELEKAKIDSAKARGLTGEEGAKQRLLKLERETIAAKLKNLEAELAMARAAGDGTRVAMLEKEIALLQLRGDVVAEGAAEIQQVTGAIESGFNQFFTDVLNGTKSAKDAFKDFAGSIVSEINSIIAKKLSTALMESLFKPSEGGAGGGFSLSGLLSSMFSSGGGSSGGGGGFMSGIGGMFSSAFSGIGSFFSGLFGGFEGGGYAMAGQPYMVGERGPELFIPGASGTVMPTEQSGGSVTVVQNISTPDANSFRRGSQQVMVDYQRALGRAGRRNG